MNLGTHRAHLASLCVVLVLVAAACSDDPVGEGKGATDTGADVSADVGSGEDADTGTSTDPDTDTNPDTGTATGLRLEGRLVPTGGLSMSSSFTLSGHLATGMPLSTSSRASFRMELTPAQSGTDNN